MSDIIYVRPRPQTLAARKHDGTHESASRIAAWTGGVVGRGHTYDSWLVRIRDEMDQAIVRTGDYVIEGDPGQFSVVPPDLFNRKWEVV